MKDIFNKKNLWLFICIIVGFCIGYILFNLNVNKEYKLPKPEISEGLRGLYGIDKNINETTIDKYLNRTDTVYRDVRMLIDTASWENKGGDRYLSGYIKGFEVIPAPFLANYTKEYIDQKKKENVDGLYTGKTLFHYENDIYTPNYEESMTILENIFPKDKNIFIMCGAGGYAGQIKNMLIKLGWDSNKLYDIGGYWYYTGNNDIKTTYESNGKIKHNFSNVPYFNIDFNTLTEIKNEK